VKERKFDAAAKALSELMQGDAPEGLQTRAALFLGITLNYQGDRHRSSCSSKARGDRGDGERTRYSLFAYAAAGPNDRCGARRLRSAVLARRRPERADRRASRSWPPRSRALKRIDELTIAGPTMAAIASRLAVLAERAGETSEAKLRGAAAPRARPSAYRAPSATTVVSGQRRRWAVGAVLPLSSNANRVGGGSRRPHRRGVSDGRGVAAIEVRAASLMPRRRRGLAAGSDRDRRPGHGESVDKRRSARKDRRALLTARPEKITAGRFVFHVRHSAEQRAAHAGARSEGISSSGPRPTPVTIGRRRCPR
jgi:hypothetical protein